MMNSENVLVADLNKNIDKEFMITSCLKCFICKLMFFVKGKDVVILI